MVLVELVISMGLVGIALATTVAATVILATGSTGAILAAGAIRSAGPAGPAGAAGALAAPTPATISFVARPGDLPLLAS